MPRGSILSSQSSQRTFSECALPHPIAMRSSARLPREDLLRPRAAQLPDGSSRFAQPSHQFRMRDRSALSGTVTGQTGIQHLSVRFWHRQRLLIGYRKPQTLSDCQPGTLGQAKQGWKRWRGQPRLNSNFGSAIRSFGERRSSATRGLRTSRFHGCQGLPARTRAVQSRRPDPRVALWRLVGLLVHFRLRSRTRMLDKGSGGKTSSRASLSWSKMKL